MVVDKMSKIIKRILISILLINIIISIQNVEAKTNTNMHIEVPLSEATEKENLVVSGWLMTESENPEIHIFIDNQEIDQPINRFERADVNQSNPGYPLTTSNQKPGFNTMVSLANYLDGQHILTINVIDPVKQEVLKEYSSIFYVQKSKSVLHLEKPEQSQKIKNELVISGWLMSDNKNASIQYFINGEQVEIPTQRIEREDVIQAMPGYGGKETNPTPGFRSILDTTNYTDGNYFLEMKIVDKQTGEILTADSRNISIKKYDGHVNIDHPTENATSGTTITIDGWVLSELLESELEIYLDNTKIESEIIRSERPDVLNAMNNGYGGNETNPTPGFSTQIDVKNIEDGQHTIEVRIKNKNTGETIATSSRKITTRQYETHINIDHPEVNSTQNNLLTIDGWYLSCYQNNSMKIYIDDQLVNSAITRSSRPDVLSAMNNGYGGKETNPTPGFSVQVNAQNYNDGLHNIKIQIVNNDNGQVIKEDTRSFYLKKYESHLNVDHPETNVKELITVDGWFLATTKNKRIEIYIDDNKVETEIKYSNRPDVLSTMNNGYGGKETNPTPGFSAQVDLKSYKDGAHSLVIKVIDEITGETITSEERSIKLKKYETNINLDNPKVDTTIDRNMKVSGWEVSTATTENIRILIDNEVQNPEIVRSERPDVIDSINGSYGGEETNPTPGFNAIIDLSAYKDGYHTITVEAVDSITNDVISSVSRKFYLQKYAGIVHLETPQTSMLNEENLFVAGWAMAELDNSYIEIYIDGVKQNSEIVRAARPDVIESVNGYGTEVENPTPSFATILDLSNLSVGKHTLEIKLYSKLDEILDETSKDLFIYKDIYFGVDVSYYQENIDWQSVRNDGINFAFIRAGYRGYGTGKIVEDTKFKDNIINALNTGMDCGVYFYTQAITEQEAIEEADFVINKLQEYNVSNRITMPIVIDVEFTGQSDENGLYLGRADWLTTQQRTVIVKAFLDRISAAGYQPMIYASRDFLYFNLYMGQLSNFDVWLAHYTSADDPLSNPSNYSGTYQVWQYTSSGTVSGINGNVDKNIGYKKY